MIGPTLPGTLGALRGPSDAIFDESGLLYVADREASRILVFASESGDFVRQIGSHGTGPGQLNHVNRLALDGARLLATDRLGKRVVVFDKRDGRHIVTFGEGVCERPNGVAVRGSRVYVNDFVQGCIHIFGA